MTNKTGQAAHLKGGGLPSLASWHFDATSNDEIRLVGDDDARCAGTMEMRVERPCRITSQRTTNQEPPVFNERYRVTGDLSYVGAQFPGC